MAALFGQVGEFDASKESWTQYAERMGLFFKANEIRDEGKKTALLLTSIGPSAYKLKKFVGTSQIGKQKLR